MSLRLNKDNFWIPAQLNEDFVLVIIETAHMETDFANPRLPDIHSAVLRPSVLQMIHCGIYASRTDTVLQICLDTFKSIIPT